MGEATLSLIQLEINNQQDIQLNLTDPRSSEYLGQVELGLRLQSKCSSEEVVSFNAPEVPMPFKASAAAGTASASVGATALDVPPRKSRGQSSWSAVVNVVLIEGRDLMAMDVEGTSDPYCKFR